MSRRPTRPSKSFKGSRVNARNNLDIFANHDDYNNPEKRITKQAHNKIRTGPLVRATPFAKSVPFLVLYDRVAQASMNNLI